jgi:hypothetical protein
VLVRALHGSSLTEEVGGLNPPAPTRKPPAQGPFPSRGGSIARLMASTSRCPAIQAGASTGRVEDSGGSQPLAFKGTFGSRSMATGRPVREVWSSLMDHHGAGYRRTTKLNTPDFSPDRRSRIERSCSCDHPLGTSYRLPRSFPGVSLAPIPVASKERMSADSQWVKGEASLLGGPVVCRRPFIAVPGQGPRRADLRHAAALDS